MSDEWDHGYQDAWTDLIGCPLEEVVDRAIQQLTNACGDNIDYARGYGDAVVELLEEEGYSDL